MAMAVAAVAVAATLACVAGGARAEAIAPVEGPWTGITSVGLPVSFQVEGGNVIDAHFGFNWGECGHFSSHLTNTDPIDPEGHWSFAAPEGQTIEGTFVGPERVEGQVLSVGRMTPGCQATHANFTAIPGTVPPPSPPQIYVVQNVNTGYQERDPTWIFLGHGESFLIGTLHWEDFGKPVAHATGEAGIRRFKREWSPQATVTLSRPIHTGPHRALYSRLHFILTGPVPAGYPREGLFRFNRRGLTWSSDPRWPDGR